MAGLGGLLARHGVVLGTAAGVLVAFGASMWVFGLMVDAGVPPLLAIFLMAPAGTVVSVSLTAVIHAAFYRPNGPGAGGR